MRGLAGQLREAVYHAPEDQEDGILLTTKSATTQGTNAVGYISDDIGLRRVRNPSLDQIAKVMPSVKCSGLLRRGRYYSIIVPVLHGIKGQKKRRKSLPGIPDETLQVKELHKRRTEEENLDKRMIEQ